MTADDYPLTEIKIMRMHRFTNAALIVWMMTTTFALVSGFEIDPTTQSHIEKNKDGLIILDYGFYFGQDGQKIKHGHYLRYSDSGAKKEVSTYKNGKLHGETTTFYDSGKKFRTMNYNEGKKQGEEVTYHEDGTRNDMCTWDNGVKTGPMESYDSKGELAIQGQFKEGKRSGTWLYYDRGRVINQHSY